MSRGSVSQRNEKTSIKHRSYPFKVAFVEHANFDSNRDITSNPHSLSTTDLISAVGYTWGRAKTVLFQGDGGVLNHSNDEETLRAVDQPCSRKSSSSRLVQENFQNSKVKQKLPYPRSSYEPLDLWKIVPARSDLYCISSTEVPSNIGGIYRWMTEIAPAKQMNQVDSVQIESTRTSNFHRSEFFTNSELKASAITCSENNNVHGQHIGETDCNNLGPVSHLCENSMKRSSDGSHEHQSDQGIVVTFDEVDSAEIEINLSSAKEISPYALAKQEHAFAGAMAGVFVSLCLHPIDTIKTVTQSCRVHRKPLHDIGRSLIAERGILGLYRGISSNIVASAPISAVYTFTYESVKKSLLPLFPKEYHSLAHCTAGGCASIATSFIFTPSERIKQQMQIGTHYRNCWSAFMQVVEKDGVLSLYNGWGAVLCRNIPHSVIKFYTYESLKQIMLPSTKSNARANLVATLVCGGLAGSMASLFTTPFDVVKTRLQTQIPGSMTPYTGVFNTLTDIGKQEGLKGLYRGLTPRLLMYMIQGALFFASYESFKGLFSLEVY